MEEFVEQVCEWIQLKVAQAGNKGVIFGLSGGVDSAVVGALCKRAFPDNCLALLMPCHSHPQDSQDALQVVGRFRIKHLVVDLGPAYDKFMEAVLPNAGRRDFVAEANIKPRLRMTTLYYFANLNGYLVVGTGNRSEIETGYFTKYGDGGVDIEPIGGLLKSHVFELARFLDIPEVIINKPPSAGLWVGQTDQQEMGITYEELDDYLVTGKASSEVKNRVEELRERSRHKGAIPPIPDIAAPR